jgi:hypothetical protein
LTLLLDEKVIALEGALADAGIPHAFGGALALAYYATPRGTHDIDLNVFLPVRDAERVLAALSPLGVAPGGARARRDLRQRGQVRLAWDHTPLDLFFAYDPFHRSCKQRVRRVRFGEGVTIPVLSAEDLSVFKVLFDRAKDRSDVAEMVYALGPDFDAVYALAWLRRMLGEEDERLRRFEKLLRPPPPQALP